MEFAGLTLSVSECQSVDAASAIICLTSGNIKKTIN